MKTINIQEKYLAEHCAKGHKLKEIDARPALNWGCSSCPTCFPELFENAFLVRDIELELNINNQTNDKERRNLRMHENLFMYSFNGTKISRFW